MHTFIPAVTPKRNWNFDVSSMMEICWCMLTTGMSTCFTVLLNALLLHPGNRDLMWSPSSLFVTWSEDGDAHFFYTAVKPLSTPMFYLHAFPCPSVARYHSRVGNIVFFPPLVPPSCSVHASSFIINMLFINSHSPLQTAHSAMHPFTCIFFPRTSWIINNLYCSTDSLKWFVCPSRLAWLTQSHPHIGPHTSSLHVVSHHFSVQLLYLDASFDHPCLPS